jgi:hypothetical protein
MDAKAGQNLFFFLEKQKKQLKTALVLLLFRYFLQLFGVE